MSEWQPMSTAPRTGERILVVWLGRVEIATWNTDLSNWQEWPDGDFALDHSEVTHWQPLPEPP